MAGNELQVLPGGNHAIDGGEAPVSDMRWDGESLDTEMSQEYFLDPCRVMAAMSLVTGEHAQRIRELQREYLNQPEDEFVKVVSEYLIEALGTERIEVRYQLMKAGEYPWPLPFG